MQHSSAQSFLTCLPLALFLSGCAANLANYPHIPQSEGHISATPAPEAGGIPAPVKTTAFVPPPKAVEKPQTYSVVVNEVPAKELLFALARDTKQNIDVHPGIQGLVTLNAVNETLPSILDRISRQVNIRYKMEGDTLVVTPDTPYFKNYNVDYVNLSRNTTSNDSVSGQISSSTGGTGGGTQPAAGGGGSANYSSTTVTSISNNNFWEVLKDNIRSILNATHAQSQSAEEKAARAEALIAAREERLQQAGAVARAGAAADKLYTTAFSGGPALPGDVKDDIVVNPVAGTVSVMATEKQHALVQQYLNGVTESSQRQVLIEASIVEVTLSDQYQAGVDFSKIGNWTIQQTLTTLSTPVPPVTTIAYAVGGSTNINATVTLLETFGKTRVLSSPKLIALNNQTALLKVVENFVYFSVTAVPAVLSTTTTAAVQQQTFNTTAQTVPLGLVMSVTPQINENGMVTLIVRPTITTAPTSVQDPNPGLIVTTRTTLGATQTQAIPNLVPQVRIQEMESVLQVGSGQVVVLGGLMQDTETRNLNTIPGLGKLPLIGDLFSFRDNKVTKSELIVFLRPTVITNPSLDSDELKFFKRFLPQAETSGAIQ